MGNAAAADQPTSIEGKQDGVNTSEEGETPRKKRRRGRRGGRRRSKPSPERANEVTFEEIAIGGGEAPHVTEASPVNAEPSLEEGFPKVTAADDGAKKRPVRRRRTPQKKAEQPEPISATPEAAPPESDEKAKPARRKRRNTRPQQRDADSVSPPPQADDSPSFAIAAVNVEGADTGTQKTGTKQTPRKGWWQRFMD